MVRALIVLMACMNLGVAIWWASHREPVTKPLPASDVGVASLTLLSEAPRAPVTDVEELSTEPEQLAAGAVCLSLGPFTKAADMRRAMNILLPHVERIQFREVPGLAVRGYRVFLPAAASRAQAQEIAGTLAARGVTDYYVVTAGAQQNTNTLGLFRYRENADKSSAKCSALGYNAAVEARTEAAAQWWIDLAASAGFDWQAWLPDTGLQAQPTACS
jgi:hypothetical protein